MNFFLVDRNLVDIIMLSFLTDLLLHQFRVHIFRCFMQGCKLCKSRSIIFVKRVICNSDCNWALQNKNILVGSRMSIIILKLIIIIVIGKFEKCTVRVFFKPKQ